MLYLVLYCMRHSTGPHTEALLFSVTLLLTATYQSRVYLSLDERNCLGTGCCLLQRQLEAEFNATIASRRAQMLGGPPSCLGVRMCLKALRQLAAWIQFPWLCRLGSGGNVACCVSFAPGAENLAVIRYRCPYLNLGIEIVVSPYIERWF